MPDSKSIRRAVGLGSAGLLIAWGVVFVAAVPASAAATTRYVAKTGSDTDNDCAVKASPCLTIGHAVDQANSGDSISIGAGTYGESVTIDISLTLTGAGTSGATDTKVDGDDGDTFFVEEDGDTQPTVTFDDLDISGNDAEDADGVLAEDASQVTVENSLVNDNGAEGIEARDDASVTVTAANVDQNHDNGIELDDNSSGSITSSIVSENGDAGIDAEGENSLTATGTIVSDNDDAGIEYDQGDDEGVRSAVTPDGASPSAKISHSTISGNEDEGVEACDGAMSIDHSTISGNTELGLVACDESTVTLATSTVSGNLPTVRLEAGDPFDGEGVFVNGDSTATITESTLSGNQGQGVLVANATATVSNSTIAGTIAAVPVTPQAAIPAGIQNAGVSVDDEIEAVVAKHATAKITPDAPAQSVVTVTGTIVAQQVGSVPDCAGTVTDGTYNVSSDHSCGFSTAKHDLINANAKLGALANNGGSTKTQLPGHGSAAIDVIPVGSAGCAGGTSDQRGVSRPQGPRCDVGAVEVAVPPIVVHPNSPLPKGTVGKAYREVLTATGGNGGPYTFTLAPGSSLPADLTLSSNGVISGVPQTAGTYTFTVSVNDPVLKKYTLVVDAAEATAPLASTGSDILPLLGGGSGFVLAGGLFLLAAGLTRRRDARHAA